MIERLINLERPYGEPEYGNLSQEIFRLKNLLYDQLEQEERGWLEQLTDAYMRQETSVLLDAFSEGFWSAVGLALEFQQRKSNNG